MFHVELGRRGAALRTLALRTLALGAAALILVSTVAQANTVVYSLTSIPNATSVVYPDYMNPSLTDTVSGTITVSSAQSIFGTWNAGNFPSSAITLTYNLSMSNSAVTVNVAGSEDLGTSINNNWIQGGGLTITPSGIFMPNPNVLGGQVLFQDLGGSISPYPLVSLNWNGNFFAFAKDNNLNGPLLEVLAQPSGSPPVDSLYGSGDTWQIATVVPEPATLVQGLMALGGLGLILLGKMRRFAGVASRRG